MIAAVKGFASVCARRVASPALSAFAPTAAQFPNFSTVSDQPLKRTKLKIPTKRCPTNDALV